MTTSPPLGARRPGRWLRWLFRAPVWLYRAHLGWLLGNRFLLVAHRGRRTGALHRTVLEVVRFDATIPEWTVVSGYGTSSDWYRNVVAAPAVRIEVGRRRFVPHQRMLTEPERRELLAAYQSAHPRAARQLGRRLLGTSFDATESSIRALAHALPAVAFRPRRNDGP